MKRSLRWRIEEEKRATAWVDVAAVVYPSFFDRRTGYFLAHDVAKRGLLRPLVDQVEEEA